MGKKDSDARYRAANREKLAEWKKANREKLRTYNREYQKKWRMIPENRKKMNATGLAYYYKNRKKLIEQSSWRNLQKAYGITQEQYENLLASQGGGCAICGTTRADGGKRLPVDHCHDSMDVRGILCEECNTLLGRIESQPGWIDKTKAYLADPPAPKIVPAKCLRIQPTGLRKRNGWRPTEQPEIGPSETKPTGPTEIKNG